MLRVAIGERDLVALLVQPGGEMDGKGAFAHTALGICDNDNHVADTTRPCGLMASNLFMRQFANMSADKLTCQPVSMLTRKHVNKSS